MIDIKHLLVTVARDRNKYKSKVENTSKHFVELAKWNLSCTVKALSSTSSMLTANLSF